MVFFNELLLSNLINIKKYFNVIQDLKNFNFEYDQNLLINEKLKLSYQRINDISETLKYQISDNNNIYNVYLEELNNLDQKFPVISSSEYFDLLKNQNNINLKSKKHKILTQNINIIQQESIQLNNTIYNYQKYIDLIQINPENEKKKNIHQKLNKFFNNYQKYFLLNFINQKIIKKSIKNSQYTQDYNVKFINIFPVILYPIFYIYILNLLFTKLS